MSVTIDSEFSQSPDHEPDTTSGLKTAVSSLIYFVLGKD